MLGWWGVGVSSGHIKVQFGPAKAAGQDLALLVKGWDGGQLCWFDPSVDLSSWYNSMATERNLIPSSGLLHASLLAHLRNKRETVAGRCMLTVAPGGKTSKPLDIFPKAHTNNWETCEGKSMPRESIIAE